MRLWEVEVTFPDKVSDAFLEIMVAEPPVSAMERFELAAVFPV
jgi:hypothetical protein